MRPFSPFAFCALVAFGLGGCTFVSEIAGSSVLAGDQHGGTVSRVTTFTQAGAMNMANSWCGQYGLQAEMIRVAFSTGGMDFACVRAPGA